ncbi:uncharacterized protein, partial [Pyxicephalus adspersus]|uniref:uncharacterized protein n=1 Tax=Pyxicephalus adspersus TaxID=30357 RepID=UPI003B5AB6EE
MMDYNNTQLLSDVYSLLEEKKSQVYFLLVEGYCSMGALEKEIFNNVSFFSFGEFVTLNYYIYDQLMHSLELLLSKPLNSSVHILNIKLNVSDQYTEGFNVTSSLSYLLITGNNKFFINFTDPSENTITLENNPSIPQYYSSSRSFLVKGPAAGYWILNAQGTGLLTVQILGFTGPDISGNCSDSGCHPNATCGEFGGDQQCTCKEGFAGDGSYCEDIDECQDQYMNNCNFYGTGSCVNIIGSYTCACNTGFEYKEEFGCVDIDECTGSAPNDCHPLAVCTNRHGTYTCTCPNGYYGDGIYCGVAQCQPGTPCNSNEDCIYNHGFYSCIDPCSNYSLLNDTWRSTSNVHNESDYLRSTDWVHCDSGLNGWYRFKGEYDLRIPEYCVPFYSCGTHAPIWMNGSHPTIENGIISHTGCANWWWGNSCCAWSNQISVKMCPEGFYVYKLQGTPNCYLAYCTESLTNTTAEPPTAFSTIDSIITTSCQHGITGASTTTNTNHNCTMREGTSFALISHGFLNIETFRYGLAVLLGQGSQQIPCLSRQYTLMTITTTSGLIERMYPTFGNMQDDLPNWSMDSAQDYNSY